MTNAFLIVVHTSIRFHPLPALKDSRFVLGRAYYDKGVAEGVVEEVQMEFVRVAMEARIKVMICERDARAVWESDGAPIIPMGKDFVIPTVRPNPHEQITIKSSLPSLGLIGPICSFSKFLIQEIELR